jgi:hypothetical protein
MGRVAFTWPLCKFSYCIHCIDNSFCCSHIICFTRRNRWLRSSFCGFNSHLCMFRLRQHGRYTHSQGIYALVTSFAWIIFCQEGCISKGLEDPGEYRVRAKYTRTGKNQNAMKSLQDGLNPLSFNCGR